MCVGVVVSSATYLISPTNASEVEYVNVQVQVQDSNNSYSSYYSIVTLICARFVYKSR